MGRIPEESLRAKGTMLLHKATSHTVSGCCTEATAPEWPRGNERRRDEQEHPGSLFSSVSAEDLTPGVNLCSGCDCSRCGVWRRLRRGLRLRLRLRRQSGQSLNRLNFTLNRLYPESGRPSSSP
jgi:hypothetical protein